MPANPRAGCCRLSACPRQRGWDASSTHNLLRTRATASPRILGGASPLHSYPHPQHCLLQPMASRPSSIPAQQQGGLGAGTRDASSVSDHFIVTGATGQTQFPEGVWVQPLDPSIILLRRCMPSLHAHAWALSILHPGHHRAALGHRSHPAACTSGNWRPAGKSKTRPRVQSVPVLEQQGLLPCPALGAAGDEEQHEPPLTPSNLHARCPAQAQRLHQVITEPTLQRPSHCGKRRAWQQQHEQRWLPGSPHDGCLPGHGGTGMLGRGGVAMGCSGMVWSRGTFCCGLVGSTWEVRGGQWGSRQAGHGDTDTEMGQGMGTEHANRNGTGHRGRDRDGTGT